MAFGGGWSRQGYGKDPFVKRCWNGFSCRSSDLTGFPTVLSCGARGQSTPRFELSQPQM